VHFRAGPLGRIDDLRGALIEDRVIVGFHPNANDFVRRSGHGEVLESVLVGLFPKNGETAILKSLSGGVNGRDFEILGASDPTYFGNSPRKDELPRRRPRR
jgi:hypothetical protein